IQFVLLRNIGTPKLPQYKVDTADGFPNTGTGEFSHFSSSPQFADIDGDGDYDCFIAAYRSLTYTSVFFWENIGNSAKPNFVRNDLKNPFSLSGYYYMIFNIADVDGDGDYDMVFSEYLLYTGFLKNTGTRTNPLFVEQAGSNNPFFYTPGCFYDWNKDGLPDYGFSQNGSYMKNIGTVGNAKYISDANGPKTQFGYSGEWVDINNDGYNEIFSSSGLMETTSSHAQITAQNINDSTVKLKAIPQGNYLYRWRKKGVIIQGATKSTLTVKQNGYYTVEIKDSCGVGTSLPYKVSGLVHTINDDESSAVAMNDKINIHSFPNPFTSEFVIQLSNSPNQNSVIKIADVNGKIVSQFTSTSNSIHAGKQLQPGIYFVQVLQNNIVVFKQKVIKQ
ncbi:MAG: T9SS type A sorting domain-containing protein, partial [Parafilimonas sp.]|nr:T9SS type A sorting domain-containing protein [Parafilimonas sp.]